MKEGNFIMANPVLSPLSNFQKTTDSAGKYILAQEGEMGYLAMLLTFMSAADGGTWDGTNPNAYREVADRLDAVDPNNSATKLYKEYFCKQIRG
jgi:hypothetical protein